MTPRHRVSRTAIDLIKRFEGYRQKAAQLPDARWTIGYGHTLTARQGAVVAENDAEALLIYDLIAVAHAVNEQVFAPLTQNQFDALCSFAFNIGLDNFRSSGVLKRLNEGAMVQAACAMELWRKAEFQGERIVIDALVRRRSAEKLLFLTPPGDAWVPAPSPILRAVLDTDAHDVVPRQAPVEVRASLDGETVEVTRADAPPVTPAPPEADEAGPAKAAAEAVTARLQTIFPDAGEEPAQAREIEPPVHPENIPEEPHPQADFGPPVQMAEEEPFALVAPPEDDDDEIVHRTVEDDEASEELTGPDLFDEPTAANDQVSDDDFAPDGDEPRTMIDDAAPFDFGAAVPRPLPEQPKGGVLSWVALAIVGLAFFAGGVFWATNARPATEAHLLSPLVVGWLAGVAGVIFFAVAVFLLLQRLGQASERAARTRHR